MKDGELNVGIRAQDVRRFILQNSTSSQFSVEEQSINTFAIVFLQTAIMTQRRKRGGKSYSAHFSSKTECQNKKKR